MVLNAPRAPADQVVTALVNEPVDDPEAKEDREGDEFVDVEGRFEDQCKEEEVEDLLLGLVHYVLQRQRVKV